MNMYKFMKKHFRHFNAAACVDAADGWIDLLNNNGKMLVTLAGAMSTAELGISLAEMIRNDKVHAISCTGANLEEDIFNLVAHDYYKRVPNFRNLKKEDDYKLLQEGMNRVTDTCIPEEEAMRRIEKNLIEVWSQAEKENKRFFPHEYIYQILDTKLSKDDFQIDPKDSWVYAAYKKNLPIFVPGWEDSTTANFFVSNVIKKKLSNFSTVKSGTEQMNNIINWYRKTSKDSPIGFFQIGGGIAGDFPICVVPLIRQDLKENCPLWSYFCQISDSTTSFGSYSGAPPNEKITWGKIDINTPGFIIESDATIVAPLIFQYILDQNSKCSCSRKELSEIEK